jgi:hypothetical protein
MVKLTDEEARQIQEGIPNLRGPILITWIRKLLEDRRERIAEAKAGTRRSRW